MTRPRGNLAIRIQAMDAGDLDRILQIEARSFTLPWTAEMFLAERTRRDTGEIFVARTAGNGEMEAVVGYVCLWLIGEEVHITNIAVDPAHRRRGLGARLMRFAMEWARGHAAGRLTLEVRASNHVAQEMYRQFGFRVAGTRRHYYEKPREDALIMTLEPIPRQGA